MRGQIEFDHKAKGLSILGIDEVGRGCLAGPVFAACVSLDYDAISGLPSEQRDLIRDSKKLSNRQRQVIVPVIKTVAREAYIAAASEREIEKLGIVPATFLAMRRCIQLCHQRYDMLLIDGNQQLPDYYGKQLNVIGGDNSCFAIAAASILAKEARDAFMRRQAESFPHYGFDKHVGYGTKHHLEMIKQFGICKLHRRNFAPIAAHL